MAFLFMLYIQHRMSQLTFPFTINCRRSLYSKVIRHQRHQDVRVCFAAGLISWRQVTSLQDLQDKPMSFAVIFEHGYFQLTADRCDHSLVLLIRKDIMATNEQKINQVLLCNETTRRNLEEQYFVKAFLSKNS